MPNKKATRKKDTAAVALPSKDEILQYIKESPSRIGKREIARAFNIKGADRPAFKVLLKELEDAGDIDRKGHRRFAETGRLPEVAVLDAVRVDSDGELIAQPANWDEPDPPPIIFVHSSKVSGRAIGVGDRMLARLKTTGDGAYEASPIRRLMGGPRQILGICEISETGSCIIRPVNRRERQLVTVPRDARSGAKHGELVLVDVDGAARKGAVKGRVVERLHDPGVEKALSLLAIHSHGIPHQWPAAALEQAKNCGPATLGKRTDLRAIPLVTIDGSDARDFDDAVWAEQDTDNDNSDGWHLIVAIADVSWYVQPDSALDRVAYERGNSTYFPDRVVPMLPEDLSNGWCSLKPHEDRPCLAVYMWVNSKGKLLRHRFVRGLMRSTARLTYEQVQAAHDGKPDKTTRPLLDTVIKPLFNAYACLDQDRRKRGALALDIPERKIIVNEDGEMTGVLPRARLASHQLIEEFMVLANVAAAGSLQKNKSPGLYRVHEPPDHERVDHLRLVLKSMDISLAPAGSVRAKDFNSALRAAEQDAAKDLVNTMVLRAQSQARYEPENLGHFGLALSQYTHFTSPIRRYSDLVVHRALVSEFKLGEGGLSETEHADLIEVAEHISMSERRSSTAERETVDRFTASFLSEKIGSTFTGKVNGVSRFGLFVTLDDTGADGILPIKRLPRDYYDVFEETHTLSGRHSGTEFTVGDPVTVKLSEADAITGSLVFDYLDHTRLRPAATAKTPKSNRKKSSSRKPSKHASKRKKRKH